jgi:hypothetical protein
MPEPKPMAGQVDALNNANKSNIRADLTNIKQASQNIMPMFDKTRSALFTNSWTDTNYLLVNHMRISVQLDGWGSNWSGDAACRGYNATPGSMTKLDAKLLQAIDSKSDMSLIKDWVDAQRTAWVDYCIGWFQMLVELIILDGYRSKLLAPSESDTLSNSYCYTTDSWRNFIHGLEYKGLSVPQWSINMAQAFTIGFKLCEGINMRSLPDTFFMPFKPGATLAMLQDLRDYLYGKQEGLLHAQKIKAKYVKFTSSLVIGKYQWVDPNSEIGIFYRARLPFAVRNASVVSDVQPQYRLNGAAATSIRIYALQGKAPHDIWALTEMFEICDGTNNLYGVIERNSHLTTGDNDYAGVTRIAFAGTDFSATDAMPKADFSQVCCTFFFIVGGGMTINPGAGWAAAETMTEYELENNILSLLGYNYKDSISANMFRDFLTGYFMAKL